MPASQTTRQTEKTNKQTDKQNLFYYRNELFLEFSFSNYIRNALHKQQFTRSQTWQRFCLQYQQKIV